MKIIFYIKGKYIAVKSLISSVLVFLSTNFFKSEFQSRVEYLFFSIEYYFSKSLSLGKISSRDE